ncbi:hypothetical protein JHW43_007678 [Diplocarpon mali]|nr:hypothetical protein JHW43_007678 [Diplocarpon mali]
MCYIVVERYSVCRCLYYQHSVDMCAAYGQQGHEIQEKTILVGIWHSKPVLSAGLLPTTPPMKRIVFENGLLRVLQDIGARQIRIRERPSDTRDARSLTDLSTAPKKEYRQGPALVYPDTKIDTIVEILPCVANFQSMASNFGSWGIVLVLPGASSARLRDETTRRHGRGTSSRTVGCGAVPRPGRLLDGSSSGPQAVRNGTGGSDQIDASAARLGALEGPRKARTRPPPPVECAPGPMAGRHGPSGLCFRAAPSSPVRGISPRGAASCVRRGVGTRCGSVAGGGARTGPAAALPPPSDADPGPEAGRRGEPPAESSLRSRRSGLPRTTVAVERPARPSLEPPRLGPRRARAQDLRPEALHITQFHTHSRGPDHVSGSSSHTRTARAPRNSARLTRRAAAE